VTAASSSSSGFGSEAADASDELEKLENEFEILTQIANAAKKLASDPSTKGRKRNNRVDSYKNTLKKLQVSSWFLSLSQIFVVSDCAISKLKGLAMRIALSVLLLYCGPRPTGGTDRERRKQQRACLV